MFVAVASLFATSFGFPPTFQLSYPVAIERSIQHWDASTLRNQILAQHVSKIAFHHDAMAVEVLDINGLQRTVDIFPTMAPVLVDSCRTSRVPFSVLPEQVDLTISPFILLILRSCALT